MSLRSALSAVRRETLCLLYKRTVPWGDRSPIVSFTFDDFPRTAYLVGGAILKKFDARGTYYTAPGLMNTANELGEQFTSEDVHSLLDDGHELACHTYSHISSRAVACSVYRNDVERGRKAMEEVAGISDSGNFSYPYGHVTLNCKRSLGPKVSSSRSIFPGCNGPEIDLNLLRANSLYGDMDQFEKAQNLILENEKSKSWLIFYSHDVRLKPSPYGCTPALFESTVSFAVQRGCRILTVKEALAELGVPGASQDARTIQESATKEAIAECLPR
jgi:peptidoglycan/xylan/chitin deacetylase (PgdA/CDA1 family)